MLLNIILAYWLRETSLAKPTTTSFPEVIKQLIIDTFTYQSIFDANSKRAIKQSKKTHPHPISNPNYDYLLKIIIVGDKNVGKTELFKSYQDPTFFPMSLSPIKMEFHIRTITVHDKRVKLQIWDLDWNTSLNINAVYRGAMGVLICYDVTDKTSLYEGVRKWNLDPYWAFHST